MELTKRFADQEIKFLDGSVVTFEIENISKDEKQLILKSSKQNTKSIEKQKDDFLDRIDFEKFNRLVILRAVKGWKGLKNKHLLIIYDCTNKGAEFQFKGDKGRETEIPFTEELRRELAEMHSTNFMSWLNDTMDGIDAENVKAKEAELKN
ncbi:MAG: hypothetical protein KKC03_14075 [Bacteroidetes bacterium]|nr:hypothetical protein [Bacteroidota bacterium]